MYLNKVSANKHRNRALILVMRVGNVMEGRRSGTISDSEAAEILTDMVEKNRDLVLDEHEDPEVKEAIRKIRTTLLPFSRWPFAV